MLVSGMSLAFHFALWVWGIAHTSLTHALLYVSITPILITMGMWVMNKPLSQGMVLSPAWVAGLHVKAFLHVHEFCGEYGVQAESRYALKKG